MNSDKLIFEDIVKKEFSSIKSVFFNTAYFGPSPNSAKKYVIDALERELDTSYYEYNKWREKTEEIRNLISRILYCSSENISYSTSSSEIINHIANGYDFKDNDTVCSIKGEYPSNILPWMLLSKRKNIKVKLLELPEREPLTPRFLERHLPKNTKIFNISHVTFYNGKKIDIQSIGEFLKQKEIFFILDATQSLGGLEIKIQELKYIDVLTCSMYKWLLGPYGCAFAYFADDALKKVKHTHANWLTSPNSQNVENLTNYTAETIKGARKFDRGQAPNMLTNSCLKSSLELINKIGLKKIQEHNKELVDYFIENYPKHKYSIYIPKECISNIISINNNKDNKLIKKLKENKIDLSVREGRIRISFHLFNNKKQIDKLIELIS